MTKDGRNSWTKGKTPTIEQLSPGAGALAYVEIQKDMPVVAPADRVKYRLVSAIISQLRQRSREP